MSDDILYAFRAPANKRKLWREFVAYCHINNESVWDALETMITKYNNKTKEKK